MFNFEEYKNIIEYLTKKIPLKDYSEVNKHTKSFLILRHDVEFLLERAYDLAVFEKKILNINSTYFFQIRNNCYNVFSDKNLEIINSIYKLGHKIGLHAHMDALIYDTQVEDYLCNDMEILEKMTGIRINRFSFHRPKRKHLEMNLNIDNVINAYGDSYFTLSDDLDNLDVVYLADSNHKWKYGYPMDVDLNKVSKVQILTHPYSWSNVGADNFNNFKNIVDFKIQEIKKSINSEIKNFPKELL